MQADTKRSMNWLNFYGILRLWGKTPAEAAAICDTSDEAREAAFETIATALAAQSRATTQITTATVQALVSMIPQVGTLAGTVMGMIGDVYKWAIDAAAPAVDKGCSSPESWARRNLICLTPYRGLGAPWFSTAIIRSLNDGLLVDGPAPAGSEEVLGRFYGVTGSPRRGSDARFEALREPIGTGKFSPKIPMGNNVSPWEDIGNNWYWRNEKVCSILAWCEHKMPCRLLNTMAWTLGPEAIPAAVSDQVQKYRKSTGSRWYASIFLMQRDFWDLVHKKGLPRLEEVLTQVGAGSAITAFRDNWLATSIDGSTGLSGDDYSAWAPERSINAWTRAMGALQWQPLMDGLKLLAGAPVRKIATTPKLSISAAQLQTAQGQQGSTSTTGSSAQGATAASSLVRYGLPIGAGLGAIALIWYLMRGK